MYNVFVFHQQDPLQYLFFLLLFFTFKNNHPGQGSSYGGVCVSKSNIEGHVRVLNAILIFEIIS